MIDTQTTWTSCVKITRHDGVVIGLTELDVPLTIDAVEYLTVSGYTPTTYSTNSELSVNNADVEGLLDAAGIDRSDILAGLFDDAAIDLFIYDYVAASRVKTLATGNWGECTLVEGRFVAEFRSLSQKLQQSIGEIYTANCRAELGDTRCTVATAPLTVTGTIDSQTSAYILVDAARTEAADSWRGGVLTFTSGTNDNRTYEIKNSAADGTLTLLLPLAYDVTAGDAYSLIPGCDKTLATCRDTYNNVVNFRGFPHVPGTLEILRIGKSGKYALPGTGTDPDAPDGTASGTETVTSASATDSFTASGLGEATGYWIGARCTWVTGDNAGFFEDVAVFNSGGYVLLSAPMPYTITAGDTFTLTLPA
ncbi:MAG: DUF2163 domain-containing protein [Georgfuchsia sp.]